MQGLQLSNVTPYISSGLPADSINIEYCDLFTITITSIIEITLVRYLSNGVFLIDTDEYIHLLHGECNDIYH